MTSTWSRLRSFYAPFHKPMIVAFILLALQQLCGLATPWFLGQLLNGVMARPTTSHFLLIIGGLFFTMIMSGVVITYAREWLEGTYIDFPVRRHIGQVTLNKVLSLSVSQLTNRHSGITSHIINQGEKAVEQFVRVMLYQVVPMVLRIVVVAIALLWMDLRIGGIVIVAGAIIALVTRHMNRGFVKDLEHLEDLTTECSQYRNEMLEHIPAVIGNAQEKRMTGEWEGKYEQYRQFGEPMWLRFMRTTMARNGLITSARILIMFVAAIDVFAGRRSIGDIAMFWDWTGDALGAVAQLTYLQRDLAAHYASIRKFFQLLDVQSEVTVLENPVRPEKFRGDIEFKNVTLTYRTRPYIASDEPGEQTAVPFVHPALRNVSFSVKAGERVAIVGESGAGKSTIVYALLRAQDPDAGQVLIDGHDLRLLDPQHFRHAIGVVEQTVPLFNESLRYNIEFGLNGRRGKVTHEELEELVRTASIDRFFDRLEHGFDTVIGQRGFKLSGGERQRVGIARALIKSPPILIFDEATSSLDAENEAIIRNSIDRISAGHTTLVIAHRFSTFRTMDRIIVMERGEVVGDGTHRELMADCGRYASLVQKQLYAE